MSSTKCKSSQTVEQCDSLSHYHNHWHNRDHDHSTCINAVKLFGTIRIFASLKVGLGAKCIVTQFSYEHLINWKYSTNKNKNFIKDKLILY